MSAQDQIKYRHAIVTHFAAGMIDVAMRKGHKILAVRSDKQGIESDAKLPLFSYKTLFTAF